MPAIEPVTAQVRQRRWRQEAEFFDRQAEEAGVRLLLDSATVRRYSRQTFRKRFSPEFRFGIVRPLEGRRVLDVGCGDGLNTVLLARLGAHVTGVDLSPKSLDLTRRRTEYNGLGGRVTLIEAPIETADLPDSTFDIVWGDGVLHHVLDDLPVVMRRLIRCARPEGLLVFSEPVNLCEPLRRLRRLIPVRTDVTPGERPLIQSELTLISGYMTDSRIRYYTLGGRLNRFILVADNYERSPVPRRAVVNLIALLDESLLSVPGLHRLAGTCVLYGHPNKAVLPD